MRLWDAASGQSLRLFEGHHFWVNSVCFSADGRGALSGSSDKLVKLWDLALGRCRQTFEGHTGEIASVCLSDDGRFAVSGAEDSTVKLWDVQTGQCVRTLEGHRYKVTSVCMSRDSRFLLSSSEDRTIKLWMLDWNLDDARPDEWHGGARPYFEAFLTLCTPLTPSTLTQEGKPAVKEKDLTELLFALGCANYGWLRPDEVRLELKKRFAAWKGPPALSSGAGVVPPTEAKAPEVSAPSGVGGVSGPEQLAAFLNKAAMGDIDNFAAFLNKSSKTDVQEAAKNLNAPQNAGANPIPIKQPAASAPTKEETSTNPLPSSLPAAAQAATDGKSSNRFTLEFCDGGSLDVLLKQRGGPLCVEEAGAIIRQALDGLEYAHTAEIPQVKQADGSVGRGRGLVHRDLKPHNIFLSGAGANQIAKIADYGLAKAFDTAGLSGQTRTGVAAGTPHFMPRQQVINFKYAKPEVDVWAMAASLYYLLAGSAQATSRAAKTPGRSYCRPNPCRSANAMRPFQKSWRR